MPPLSKLLRWPLRALKSILGWLLTLVVLFEEWGWEPLNRVMVRLGQLPGPRWLGQRIAALPPYGAVAIFLLPTALLLPVKLAALWFIGRGMVIAGTLVLVVAKLGGTALIARLFTLTRPALMTLPWFAHLYARWSTWKAAQLKRVRGSRPWRLARQMRQQLRSRWSDWKAK